MQKKTGLAVPGCRRGCQGEAKIVGDQGAGGGEHTNLSTLSTELRQRHSFLHFSCVPVCTFSANPIEQRPSVCTYARAPGSRRPDYTFARIVWTKEEWTMLLLNVLGRSCDARYTR